MTRTRPVPDHGDPDRPLPNPDPPRGKDDGKGNGDGGPHYTTWLLLRYQAGDTGVRPLSPGSVFWESPDVWTQGSQGVNQPVAGEPTQVFARVSNLGMEDAVGVTISYYWADPSVAIVQDPTKLIGQITDGFIPAGNSLVFQSPTDWVPTEVNNGHECLVVEAFIPVFDGLTDPMHPVTDCHVGQKNEQLVTLQAGQSFHFHLSALNFTTHAQDIVIEARPGAIPRNFTRLFGRPDMWKTELLDPIAPLPLTIHVDAKPGRITTPPPTAARRLAATVGRADIGCLAPPQATATQRFRAGEVRAVTITGALPPSAQPGEVYVIRIIQRIGEIVVGGYTLYVTLADGQR